MTMDGKYMDADEITQNEINRIKDNESELYALDREKQKVMAEIQAAVSKIETKQQTMDQDIQELKTDMTSVKTDMTSVKSDITTVKVDTTELKVTVKDIQEKVSKSQWQPKDICTIVVAVLALIGTVITAILK